LRSFFVARLLPHSAEAMDVLRGQPDVPHDREAGRCEPTNRLRDGASTFDLHRGGAAFLEEACRVAHGLLGRNLICQKRHVSHDQRATGGARHGARVVKNRIQGYGDRCVQSQDHVPEGVAHQQQVDARAIE
jgi:hypothetical protein